jgi:hypothetical protein
VSSNPILVGYPLKGDALYLRRSSAPTVLLSLGRTLAKLEQAGHTTEAVFLYPAGNDWVATALTQDPDAPPCGVIR